MSSGPPLASSRWRYRKALAAAIILVAGAGITVALVRKEPVPVKVQVLRPGELRVVVNATTTSTVKSEYEAVLAAQRTGRVTHLAVRDGDRVRAGQVIARLDLTEEAVQSESVLAQSKATFEEAEKNYQRNQELYGKHLISQQDLDAVRRAFEVARSQYEAARSDVGVRRDYSVIRAPFDGVVAKKHTETGELLLPGKQIATLVDPSRIYVLATIDEVDVGRLRLGQTVIAKVDAFPDEMFSGTVGRISPIVSGGKLETRTADVWVYLSRKDERLKPGMSADVEILVTTLQDVLSVPTQAVVERNGRKQVFALDGKDLHAGDRAVARLTPVEVGESNWVATEIRKGVSAGAYVVTTPEAEGLREGSPVRIDQVTNAR